MSSSDGNFSNLEYRQSIYISYFDCTVFIPLNIYNYKVGAATFIGTIGIGFAYTAIKLFWFNQRNYVRSFKKFQDTKLKV